MFNVLAVFCDVMLYSLGETYQRFEGRYCPHLQGRKESKQQAETLRAVASQKTVVFTVNAERTSDSKHVKYDTV
jgi:uncharacterized protein YeaO (DUF488 family)